MVMGRVWYVTVLVLMVTGCLWAAPAAAVQAYVDRNPVAEDESFTLTLESSGDVNGSPDLSPLRKDFDIQGQGRNTSVTIVNGSVSRKTQWQISLMPKHSGKLQIPPIRFGGKLTQPLTVTVTPASQVQAAKPGGDLYMKVSVEPHTAYVQQQFIYTVRLYHTVDLGSGATLSPPGLPGGDAVVEKLGKASHYQTVRNSIRYHVIEQRYAIYPQKSGAVDITPVVFNGDIVQGGGGGGFFNINPFNLNLNPFNQNTRHKRLRSEALHITVKPIPAAFHGSQWLPSRNVQLMETWVPDPPKFTVGQAVTRTVALLADGLTAAQLPSLGGGTVSGLKQYPDQPALKDTKDSQGISGMRTEKIAYIPSHPGKITLPGVKIPWWNTATDQMELASLPPHTYDVAPAAPGGTPAAQAPAPAVAPAPVPAPASTSAGSPQSTRPATTLLSPSRPATGAAMGRWPWLALVLGLGWVATAAAWWWHARRRSGRVAPGQPPEDETLRQLERKLKSVCLANDAAGASAALLAWARRRWPARPPMSLTAVARLCSGPLSAALMELDHALHARGAGTWQGRQLWERFAADKPAPAARRSADGDGLAPLYGGD